VVAVSVLVLNTVLFSARKATWVPGHELDNVVTLRSVDDAQRIATNSTADKDVVIMGTSFIGKQKLLKRFVTVLLFQSI
jgi:hypothetical protein